MLGNIIVVLIVLLSVIMSGRKIYKTLTGKHGCSCAGGNTNNGVNSCCNTSCCMKSK